MKVCEKSLRWTPEHIFSWAANQQMNLRLQSKTRNTIQKRREEGEALHPPVVRGATFTCMNSEHCFLLMAAAPPPAEPRDTLSLAFTKGRRHMTARRLDLEAPSHEAQRVRVQRLQIRGFRLLGRKVFSLLNLFFILNQYLNFSIKLRGVYSMSLIWYVAYSKTEPEQIFT